MLTSNDPQETRTNANPALNSVSQNTNNCPPHLLMRGTVHTYTGTDPARTVRPELWVMYLDLVLFGVQYTLLYTLRSTTKCLGRVHKKILVELLFFPPKNDAHTHSLMQNEQSRTHSAKTPTNAQCSCVGGKWENVKYINTHGGAHRAERRKSRLCVPLAHKSQNSTPREIVGSTIFRPISIQTLIILTFCMTLSERDCAYKHERTCMKIRASWNILGFH